MGERTGRNRIVHRGVKVYKTKMDFYRHRRHNHVIVARLLAEEEMISSAFCIFI